MNTKLLIIANDIVNRESLLESLPRQSYDLLAISTCEESVDLARRYRPKVILLDLKLPDEIDVISTLCQAVQAPAIVLSRCAREEVKVAALDAGADDYLVKPCGAAELQARIRVALRRARRAAMPEIEPTLCINDLCVDLSRRQVHLRGQEVHFTPTEYKLLKHLVLNAGTVVEHREILQTVWGPEYDTEINYLRIYIQHLRRKIEDDPANPRYILNEPGIGYRLVADQSVRSAFSDDEAIYDATRTSIGWRGAVQRCPWKCGAMSDTSLCSGAAMKS